jgi:hypothetical protein
MPHPPRHAGQLPAPPAVPCPAGTGGQQAGPAASGPGIGEPLSVWPATPAPGPAPGPGPEAAHVITSFSRPGELVVIPAAGTGTLLSAAAAAGRRVLGPFPGPADCHAASSRLDQDLDPARRPQAHLRAGGPGLLLEAGCPETGQAALAITGRGRPGDGGMLYTACERMLRPGGVLAVLTASTPCRSGLRDDPGEVIAAARAAGLIYAQHIVALHAAITAGQRCSSGSRRAGARLSSASAQVTGVRFAPMPDHASAGTTASGSHQPGRKRSGARVRPPGSPGQDHSRTGSTTRSPGQGPTGAPCCKQPSTSTSRDAARHPSRH